MRARSGILLATLVAAWAGCGLAAPAPAPLPKAAAPVVAAPPPSLSATLAADQASLRQLTSHAAITSDDGQLSAMAAQAAAIQASARQALAPLVPQLAAVNARLADFTRHHRHPTPSESAKAAPLIAQRTQLAGEVAQAQAVVAAAGAAFNQIAERRREGFSARVLTRSQSPLAPAFWTSLGVAAGADLQRFDTLADEAVGTALAAAEPRAGLGLGFGLAVALALGWPIRRRLERLGRRGSGEGVHPGLAHTGAALWVAAVDAGAPAFAAAALRVGAEWGGVLSPAADALADGLVVAIAWAAGILALGRVLATERDASQRLLPLDDATARRVRLPLAVVAVVTGAGFMLTRLNYVAGASVAATIAANCAVSIAYAGAAVLALVSFGAGEPTALDAPKQLERPRGPAWTLVSLILTGAVLLTLGAVLTGYTTLAALTSGQIFWLSLIGAAAYLIMRFADDLMAALFSPHGWASRALFQLFRLRGPVIAQIGALVTAAAQIIVILVAVSFAVTPFGRGGDLLIGNLGELAAPMRLGTAIISPPSIAAGILTFLVGMGVARVIQGWVVRRYVPVTDWDAGVRNSVVTGIGYLGVGLAILAGLSASGVGLGQIALIASALSVGIGFGLQQVVQNFVAGLILLVERPVKVGDWVNIDHIEGNVRRIRVRATEIETFDRAMVIVPNSDLISKAVQNKTLGRRARVQLKLAICKPEDVGKTRDLVLKIAAEKTELLEDPPPAVFIEGIGASGAVNLTCNLFIANPRDAYRVRSEVYFALLEGFDYYDIAFTGIA